MLDWIFEGIIDWVAGIASSIMDAISGLFLNALGTDMTAMEEYFPFVSAAFDVMQYMAWALLFLICVWQLFRVFGGPITDAENPWQLVAISTIVAVTVAAVALIVRMVSRNQRAVDEATSWLKRIVITWIVLNSLGFIVAYLQPLIAGGQYTGG